MNLVKKLVPVLLIIILASCHNIPEKKIDSGKFDDVEFHIVVRDLHTLNLVNGLFLSKEQMEKMIPIVERVKKADEELKSARDSHYSEYITVLKEMRSQLLENSSITDAQQEKLNRASMEIDKKSANLRDVVNKSIPEIKDVLNVNQHAIINGYEPCIVPTKDVSHPERIGGLGDGEDFEDMLRYIRKVPDKDYPRVKLEILKKREGMMKVHNNDLQIKSVLKQIETSMDKARELDSTQFEIEKDELSRVLIPPAGRPGDEFYRNYLLNPFMVRMLKNKLSVVQ
ncbi:MAG: hypothetical protein K8T10_06950 [Candidatus Eremiobacteraeota bacterium]|nr:hypothetical protein [Candidatus Eremiobacteraeota bacterium]